MIIYKIVLSEQRDGSKGAIYKATKREARRVRARYLRDQTHDNPFEAEIEEIKIDRRPTKGIIIELLQTHGSHADNG